MALSSLIRSTLSLKLLSVVEAVVVGESLQLGHYVFSGLAKDKRVHCLHVLCELIVASDVFDNRYHPLGPQA
jgi:hypothetical protein